MLLQLAFLFVFLGTAASDFFCPNLYTAAEALRLPQDVAGVTLLALGNSAPDLFSSVVAIHGADAISLALGELVGAGLVIGGAVTGCVVLFARHGKNSPLAGEVMDISVDKRIFLRDVGFFLLSILVLVVILFDGKMYWYVFSFH
jgi:sodium/potassium/calcium exchanger 6